jgi:hypothetical protein
MTRRHARFSVSLLFPALVVSALAWSCGAIIGTRDITLGDDPDAVAPAAESGMGADVSTPPPNDEGGMVTEAGPCSDTMADKLNCGKCGHSCLGGACLAGACQPVTLASGFSARDVLVDKEHVYWIEPNLAKAMQANKDGTNALQLGGGTVNILVGLAIDDTNVFWDSRDEIVLRCKIGGCTNTPAVVTSDASLVQGLAVDATNVYWVEQTTPGQVRKAAKSGTTATSTALFTDPAPGTAGDFTAIATDGVDVFWAASDGKIRRISNAGGAVTVVGTGTGTAYRLAVDDQNVYWSAGEDTGTINIAPKGGANGGTVLAAQQSNPLGVAVDQNSIYWVSAATGIADASGMIMTCTIAGCVPKPLATGQRTPTAIAVDDTAIYWSNFDAGNSMGGIMRLAK